MTRAAAGGTRAGEISPAHSPAGPSGSPAGRRGAPGRRLYLTRSAARRLVAVFALLSAAVAAVRGAGLRVQHTASLPTGVYREVAGGAARGTVGMWCPPLAAARTARARDYVARGACPGDVEPLGKLVLGVAGDTIHYGPAGVTLNGRAVPVSRPLAADSKGRALAHAPFGPYVLRAGQVWVWSPFSPASFDSRYFGPLPASALVSRVVPLWTARRALPCDPMPFPLPFPAVVRVGCAP